MAQVVCSCPYSPHSVLNKGNQNVLSKFKSDCVTTLPKTLQWLPISHTTKANLLTVASCPPHKRSDTSSQYFPPVHSASALLASTAPQTRQARNLGTGCSFCLLDSFPEGYLLTFFISSKSFSKSYFSLRPIFITLFNTINFPLHSHSPYFALLLLVAWIFHHLIGHTALKFNFKSKGPRKANILKGNEKERLLPLQGMKLTVKIQSLKVHSNGA